jgi:hypothetical protein
MELPLPAKNSKQFLLSIVVKLKQIENLTLFVLTPMHCTYLIAEENDDLQLPASPESEKNQGELGAGDWECCDNMSTIEVMSEEVDVMTQ